MQLSIFKKKLFNVSYVFSVCMCACVKVPVQSSEDNLQESVLLLLTHGFQGSNVGHQA